MGAVTAMLCPNCGFESGSIFSFCSSCGRSVPSGVAVTRDDVSDGSRALRWVVFGSTLLVPVVGIVMGARYVADPRLPQRALGRWWLASGIVVALLDTWL